MQLSVIIVSYNVRYFLEQCLCSVKKAMEQAQQPAGHRVSGGGIEVLVIDNQSADDSIAYLQPRFPFARFIANTENAGFGRANNQALAQCQGKYILFLNPDTILPEDCFQQCLAFMDSHADAAALGVRMIDGGGQYLPESKRGFPSPWVSFCKMSGLTRLFPRSPFFAHYYLGHLPASENHPVDVLSGAFMWARKSVLDKTGGFDERFFMYAEDIDLSYRIQQAGYQNYYFAGITVLHFKGESTRRDARYVKQFYTAMIQFVQKHFKGLSAWWYIKLLQGIIAVKGKSKDPSAKALDIADRNERIYLSGDKGSVAEMLPIVEKAGKSIAGGEDSAHAWVWCEGETCSFKNILQTLQEATGKRVYIHAKGSGSAAGSHDKNDRGKVLQ
jgi:N-acetylglucosaminyl-diphospho-decaprenol L-rhamnosyltransferase